MSESSITPLARRLAEENNVDWMALPGSGPDGWVVEKDVLEYLARVMEGSEAVDPTEEPLPEGLSSWDEADVPLDPEAWQGEPVAGREPEAAPVGRSTTDDWDDFQLETGLDEAGLLDTAPVETETETEVEIEAEIELDEGIFLLDDESAESAATSGQSQKLTAGTLESDDDFMLTDDVMDDQTALLADDLPNDDLLDDDYLEDDFLTDLATEDGELDSAEVADADLHGFGVFGGQPERTGEIDLLTDDVDLLAFDSGSPTGRQAEEYPSGGFGSDPFETSWTDEQEDEFEGNRWVEEPNLTRRSLQDHLQAGVAPDDFSAESFEVDFSEISADDASLTTSEAEAAEAALWDAEPQFTPEAEVEAESEPALERAAPSGDVPAAAALAFALAGLPLVSHGTLLRRNVDVTQLGQVQLAVALELGQEEHLDALPFLLRAAQRSGPLAGSEGSGVAAASLQGNGMRIIRPDDAGGSSFGELARCLLDQEQAGDANDLGSGVSVIACDMSALQVDEAVLHLDSPVLALGRVLFDSEQGTYHSTLTLSGTFNPEAGARFLQDVSELLASPVRLLI